MSYKHLEKIIPNTCLDELISTPGGLLGGVSLWAVSSYLLATKALPHLEDVMDNDNPEHAHTYALLIIIMLVAFGGAIPFTIGAGLGRLVEPCLLEAGRKTKECYNQPNSRFLFFPITASTENVASQFSTPSSVIEMV